MEISAQTLKDYFLKGENFQLIDIREHYEFEAYNIGGINIPMDEVLANLHLLDLKKPIVFCCTEGLKSKALINILKRKIENSTLYSLSGGIINYYEEFEI